MAATNLLEGLGQGIYNTAYTAATGKPVPGSREDKLRQLENATLNRQLREALQDPQKMDQLASTLRNAKAIQGLNLEGTAAQNRLNLDYLGASSLLDAAKGKSDIKLKEMSAETANEINRIAAANKQRLELLAPVQKLEGDLRLADTGDLEKVLSFYSAAQDKNLAAQAAARKPGFGGIASLLGGLGLAAASLFG